VGSATLLCGSAACPEWPVVSLPPASAFVPVDRVHGQLGCGAPCSPFRRHVVALPLRNGREEARGAYKRSRCSTVARDRSFET
jgi:hypothetical protein